MTWAGPPMRDRRPAAVRHRKWVIGFGILAIPALSLADTADRPFTGFVADQYTYDDNLFRLPAQFSIGSGIARQDHINTLSAGGDGQWTLGRQSFAADFRVNNSRYSQNDDLNNTAGFVHFNWDWTLSPFLFGDAGGDFTRSLAGFANTHFFQRDLIDTTDYFADFRVRFAQHWTLKAGGRDADTTHSLDLRAIDDFRAKSAAVSVEYLTDEQSSIALEYAYTNARFAQTITIDGAPFDPNYNDSAVQLLTHYALSGKLLLDASVGYLDRRYPNANFGSFSGNVWKGTLEWQLTGKTALVFGAWRQLTAYLGSESDYFVARGESISPTWHATERITVALSASRAKQDYLASSPSALEYASRRDTVQDQQINLTYTPREYLDLQLAYTLEERDSNQYEFSYHDRLLTASLKFVF
jgi:exopolysaccharide biosynthesis operon protein EpsL